MDPATASNTETIFLNPKIADHLRPYQVPPTSYTDFFSTKTGSLRSRLVASAIVIQPSNSSSTKERCVLLLQRAAHNFQPLLWEVPGGRCEVHDSTIIASAVRELWEETGLVANRVADVIGEYEWLDHDERWRKIVFLVEVDSTACAEHDGPGQGLAKDNDGEGDGSMRGDDKMPRVTIDSNEQATYLWATKEEVIASRCGNTSLKWTSDETRQMILRAFELLSPQPCRTTTSS